MLNKICTASQPSGRPPAAVEISPEGVLAAEWGRKEISMAEDEMPAEAIADGQGPFDEVPAPDAASAKTVAVQIRGHSLGARASLAAHPRRHRRLARRSGARLRPRLRFPPRQGR